MEGMNEKRREALDKTLVCLKNDLAIEEALVYLQSKGILTEHDVDAIDQPTSTRIKKVLELVKRIKQKGNNSYSTFKNFLEETEGLEHIAIELDKNLKEVEQKLANVTQEREKARETEKWKKLEEKFHNPSFSCEHDRIHRYQGISRDINVLLLGQCGAGKSATGNTLLGKDIFEESDTDAPETKSVQFETINEGTFNITVVDTPGIQNEELLLNVVDKMIDFEGGIHLFLLVCEEKADQEIIKVISRIFAETACDQCVVILTNARARFVGKKRMILRDYIEREKYREEPLADLFQLVQQRVIAVENGFDEDDDTMIDQQRQKLLCCLAQVIKDNKGIVYSKISFQNAKTRIKQDEALKNMKGRLHEYLLQKYLKTLSQQQLDNIQTTLDDNVEDIMQASHVLDLCPLITKGDALQYMRLFIKENENEISKMKNELCQKIQAEEKRQNEIWKALEEKCYCFSCKYDNIENYTDVPKEINILLIGKTGSGKSATGNTIIGKPSFVESGTSKSVTKTISMKSMKEGGFQITVIDTPGLFDTAKDIKNEDMVLEIAKTLINFKGGIHLFLLVLSSSSRFTNEEQLTIKVIEEVLGKKIYRNCLVVLTNARTKFGSEKNESLQQYVESERKDGGQFSDLLNHVSKRIIAVENCFDDDFLKKKHRQKLLCCLAQIIYENKGSVYSNKAFDDAKARVEQQEKEQKRRISRRTELTHMETMLRKFLMHNYLTHLTEKELDNILPKVRKETLHIMTTSGVKLLTFITDEDVQTFVKSFIQDHQVFIANLKDQKIQERIQQLENEKTRQWLKEEVEIRKMQGIVFPLVSQYLKQQSKQALEQIVRYKQLPDNLTDQIIAVLVSNNVHVDLKRTKTFIQETYFENPTQIQRYIDDKLVKEKYEEKLKQLQKAEREQKLNEIMGTIKTNLQKYLAGKACKELKKLRIDLKGKDHSGPGNWESIFIKLVGSQIRGSDISIKEVTNLFLKHNNKWIQCILEILFANIEEELLIQRKLLKDRILVIISKEIQIELKNYLTGKNKRELSNLKILILEGQVPQDIFEMVNKKLTDQQKGTLSDTEVKAEIRTQITEQYKLITDVGNKTKSCFAGSTEVRIKKRGIVKISNVRVNDEILVFDDNGNLFYDKVYLILHAIEYENITFVRLQTSSDKDLHISPEHILPIGSLGSNVAAKDVSLGNAIFTLQDGVMMPDKVTSVTYELCRGAYCPVTMHGTIVVNDVAASCYTTFLPAPLVHALLSPVRFLFSYLPLPLFNKLLPYDTEEGMPVLLLKCRIIVNMWR